MTSIDYIRPETRQHIKTMPLEDLIWFAINDPGAFAQRKKVDGTYEHLGSWGARAVLIALEAADYTLVPALPALGTGVATPPVHFLRIRGDRLWLDVVIECRAPVGAPCRQCCARSGCDWEDGPPHADPDGTEHGVKDGGRCFQAEWVNAEAPDDLHDPDVPNDPLYDGMPVDLTWNGDGYYWSSVGAQAVKRAATPHAPSIGLSPELRTRLFQP